MGQSNDVPAREVAPTPPRLAAGGLVAGGRYELLRQHGGMSGQAFWEARDRRLGRTVALTFVDPLPGEQAPGSATGVLDRTVALTGVYSDGLARVLDVIRGRAGGIVVTEWIPGRSLSAAVSSPDPDSAVRAVWGLSDAATIAEEKGLVLGLDSPDRVRLTEDGRAVLAFPGVRADVDSRSDVRGLGAVLYALLTGAWPVDLPEGSEAQVPVDGRPGAAERDDDELVDPTVAGSGVAPDSAVLAMRSLDGTAVSSAATVRAMVAGELGSAPGSQASARPAAATAGLSPGGVTPGGLSPSAGAGLAGAGVAGAGLAGAAGASAAGAGRNSESDRAGSRSASQTASHTTAQNAAQSATPSPGSGVGSGTDSRTGSGTDLGADTSGDGADSEHWFTSAEPTDPDVQKRRWQIMAGVSAAAVVGIVVLAMWLLGALSGDRNDTPLSAQLDAIERAAQASRESATATPQADGSGDASGDSGQDGEDAAAEKKADASPIGVSTATSWQPADSNGNAENSGSAPNVVDGDPSTSWSTDTYRDQFGSGPGAFKAGIGLMLTLDEAAEVKLVELSAEEDIRFEVRASESADPTSLDETTRLGSGRVSDGEATVEIDAPEEAEYILVWITRLGTAGSQAYNATVSEVELLG